MEKIDFITAFGRLLRDGKLRDTFAASPRAAAQQIQLRASDWPAWLQLEPIDLEFQAGVLLHKRLDLVKTFVPETCRRLGERLWPEFKGYARLNWPTEQNARLQDSIAFCRQLKQSYPNCVLATECNRLKFALSKQKILICMVSVPTMDKKHRSGFQLFLRGRGPRWREFFIFLRS